ncbi:MAG TPA: polysaccharide deacetylase family protein [Thermoanaerobaculia bacterium]|nr:polysaccharide deacetylase family protein [Thermoanaerobaculia bacterium]
MLDVAAFIVLVTIVTVLLNLLISPRGRRRAAGLTISILVSFLLSATGTFQLSRSRSFQFFGHLITAKPTEEKLVALTFDDGPTARYTSEILDVLRREGVTATFFLIGRDMEGEPRATQLIAEAGHEIGNHSLTHQRMMFKSEGWIRREIERTDALIRQSGYSGPIHFRLPYGKRFVSLPYYLMRNKRLNIFFDVEPESDPEIAANRDAIVRDVLRRTTQGSIVLLHVMYKSRAPSREALPAIIQGLKNRGYRFVSVSALLSAREQPQRVVDIPELLFQAKLTRPTSDSPLN